MQNAGLRKAYKFNDSNQLFRRNFIKRETNFIMRNKTKISSIKRGNLGRTPKPDYLLTIDVNLRFEISCRQARCSRLSAM